MFDRQQYPRLYAKAFTYNVTTPAVAKPLTLDEVKEQIKIDLDDTSQDDYLNLLIDAVTLFGESYTKRDFINKGYTTFRDSFCDNLLLRRSKVKALTSISYLNNGIFNIVDPTTYGFTNVNDFSQIFLQLNKLWPENIDCIPQAVKILFTAGYGDNPIDVPANIKLALLSHISFLYENRGDCTTGCGCDSSGNGLPVTTKALYNNIRILDIGAQDGNCEYYNNGRLF